MYALPKNFNVIWLSHIVALTVPDKGYFINRSCALNLISTFLVELLGFQTLWL